jgi:peptidoglycan/LPS O-acetylase OafA/YrhL
MGCLFALYKDWIIEKLKPYWPLVFWTSLSFLFGFRYISVFFAKYHLDFIFIPFGTTHGPISNFLIALIMMYSVFGPQGMWFKFLNFKLLNYVGMLSYSIYLWQQFFINKSTYWVNRFPQNILFVATSALFSYYVIEKPFLKLKDKFSSLNNKKAAL